MNYEEYLEKIDSLDRLEARARKLGDEYRTCRDGAIAVINQLREIYDIQLIESG